MRVGRSVGRSVVDWPDELLQNCSYPLSLLSLHYTVCQSVTRLQKTTERFFSLLEKFNLLWNAWNPKVGDISTAGKSVCVRETKGSE
jgi:hypothetical protein